MLGVTPAYLWVKVLHYLRKPAVVDVKVAEKTQVKGVKNYPRKLVERTSGRFSLRDVATYYSGQLHQKEALDMIQMYIPLSIEERFADMWRSGPKNEIPSHVSWHERLRQLLSPEVQLQEEMNVERVYLLFAELLIQQSRSADPEYADRLLSLIEVKKEKRKRDYNWMD